MFPQLSQKLANVFKNLRHVGVIRESHILDAVRAVRIALLEADVNVGVVKAFLERVKERSLGQEVIGSGTAGRQFYKIVQEELVRILGSESKNLPLTGKPPHVLILVGLQGCGKTTTAAKLALYLKKQGRRPYLVPADFHRPAAVEQLKMLARQTDIPCHDADVKNHPVKTAVDGVREAGEKFCDVVIVDTAGRLHVDAGMMQELKEMRDRFEQAHVLFVADAMTGQAAVSMAKEFHTALGIDGLILTKMDGDAKGGAALSIQSVAGCPIYFTGMGEKITELESFHPDRLVSRLLDRGDLLTLVERAKEIVDEKEAGRLAEKIVKNNFDLEDFLAQLKQMKKLGSIGSLVKFLPGAGALAKNIDLDRAQAELKKKEAIIHSMTPLERGKPAVLNGSRRSRIAFGSGTSTADVNRFMKEFEQMKKMMKRVGKGEKLLNMFKTL